MANDVLILAIAVPLGLGLGLFLMSRYWLDSSLLQDWMFQGVLGLAVMMVVAGS